jgi:hypothetical protein
VANLDVVALEPPGMPGLLVVVEDDLLVQVLEAQRLRLPF